MQPIVWIAVVLAGIGVGGMLYTTLLTAPIIFIALDASEAHRFTRRLWPRYFLLNAVVGLAVGCLLYLGPAAVAGPAYAAFGVAVFMGINYLLTWPITWSRREDSDENASVFDWLHRVTVWLNWASLGLLGWAFIWVVRV